MKRKNWIPFAVVALLVLTAGAGPTIAPFEVNWSTTEAGQTMTGGPYTVFGVAGQPDAGELGGGPYTIRGGYIAGGGTATGVRDDGGPLPGGGRFVLHPGVPNPFNPSITIRFDVPTPDRVQLSVYDVKGRFVRTLVDERLVPGPHTVSWDGIDAVGARVASGVYLVVMESGGYRLSQKITMLK